MNELVKDLIYVVVLFCVVWCIFYLYTRHDTTEQRMVRYDCRISEFAPDIPQDVRAECRRRAIELYNQQKLSEKE